jgi:hypothetical protein
MRAVIQNLAEARAALERAGGRAVELWSPPDGASIQGVLWFVALRDALRAEGHEARLVLDCGSRADLAIEAMRAGLHDIAFKGSSAASVKVADIAQQLGSRVHPPVLD